MSSDNFPARRSHAGAVREVVPVELDHDGTTREVMAKAARLGLEPPVYEDALYLGVEYPEVQREKPVVFLHDPRRPDYRFAFIRPAR